MFPLFYGTFGCATGGGGPFLLSHKLSFFLLLCGCRRCFLLLLFALSITSLILLLNPLNCSPEAAQPRFYIDFETNGK